MAFPSIVLGSVFGEGFRHERLRSMSGKNRLLVVDEPVEVQDFRKFYQLF